MTEFGSIDSLFACFSALGVERVYCKFLAENDSSKQQVYLGNSFEVLKLLKFGTIRADANVKEPNFKASVPFFG